MCGRFTLTAELDTLEERFSFKAEKLPYVPRYNITPTQQVIAVLNGGHNHAELLLWGLYLPGPRICP